MDNQNVECIQALYLYRGTTDKQLAIIVYEQEEYTLSREKNIYNSLRKLKNQGIVQSIRLQDNFAKGPLYYLT
ncbi:hypothetical protein COK05_16000 [Bacillus cereus]|uniref:Uncharacterized protein n=1 Tax=Bacillus cereus TaxID=1396 RepID=A0A2B2LJ54_BACCE|nr:hypothetical protein [Bacillus cereus]PFQ44837.1 hypothetical protein COK05_16000 [Bacillus cereus]